MIKQFWKEISYEFKQDWVSMSLAAIGFVIAVIALIGEIIPTIL